MSNEVNKALVQRFYDEWKKGNWDGVKMLLDDNLVDHNPQPGQAPGADGLIQGLQAFGGAFPDMQFTIDRMIAEGDRVMDQGRARATHSGAFAGIPATHKPVDFTFTDWYRIANGKIVEVWHVEDIVTVMQQIGVMPAMTLPEVSKSSQKGRTTRTGADSGMSTPAR